MLGLIRLVAINFRRFQRMAWLKPPPSRAWARHLSRCGFISVSEPIRQKTVATEIGLEQLG
jgi:hypothetical protein